MQIFTIFCAIILRSYNKQITIMSFKKVTLICALVVAASSLASAFYGATQQMRASEVVHELAEQLGHQAIVDESGDKTKRTFLTENLKALMGKQALGEQDGKVLKDVLRATAGFDGQHADVMFGGASEDVARKFFERQVVENCKVYRETMSRIIEDAKKAIVSEESIRNLMPLATVHMCDLIDSNVDAAFTSFYQALSQ